MIDYEAGTTVLSAASTARENSLRANPPPWWLWTNIFSLDAVSVAVVWQIQFARTYHARIGAAVPFALGCSVWLIYAMDHLLDTAKRPSLHEPPRKAFFRRYRRIMSGLTACGALSTILFAQQFLSPQTFQAGLICGALVFLYLVAVHLMPLNMRAFWPRQAAIASLFSTGVAFPVWVQARPGASTYLTAVLFFLLLCWLNCCAVEVWEWQEQRPKGPGKPDRCGRWLADHLTMNTIMVVIASCCLEWWGVLPSPIATSTFLTGAVFITITLWRKRNTRTRTALSCVLLDLALMSPLLTILWK